MKITLYVDVVSPFAYIAYHILRVCDMPTFSHWAAKVFSLTRVIARAGVQGLSNNIHTHLSWRSHEKDWKHATDSNQEFVQTATIP